MILLAMARASGFPLPLISRRKESMVACLLPLGPALIWSMTASWKRLRPAFAVHWSSISCSWVPFLPACSAATIRSLRGWMSGFVEPTMKAWSRGSMVEVMRVAASESVLAMARRSVPGRKGEIVKYCWTYFSSYKKGVDLPTYP